jgi:hypothetical protein
MEHIEKNEARQNWNDKVGNELDEKFEKHMTTPEAQKRIEQSRKDALEVENMFAENMNEIRRKREKLQADLAEAYQWIKDHEGLPSNMVDPIKREFYEGVISRTTDQLATLGGEQNSEEQDEAE